jgi:hypothetical protein
MDAQPETHSETRPEQEDVVDDEAPTMEDVDMNASQTAGDAEQTEKLDRAKVLRDSGVELSLALRKFNAAHDEFAQQVLNHVLTARDLLKLKTGVTFPEHDSKDTDAFFKANPWNCLSGSFSTKSLRLVSLMATLADNAADIIDETVSDDSRLAEFASLSADVRTASVLVAQRRINKAKIAGREEERESREPTEGGPSCPVQ